MRVAGEIQRLLSQSNRGPTSIDVIEVPGGAKPREQSEKWAGIFSSDPGTAVDTTNTLRAVVSAQLAASIGRIVVISDQELGPQDSRLIHATPDTKPSDVGIAAIQARSSPRPQVMVTVLNQSELRNTTLTIKSGDEIEAQQITLPPTGQTQNYFIDFKQFSDLIEARLDVSDDLPADDRAWLVRERTWPRIVPSGPVSPQIQRMINVYSRRHPASESSRSVILAAAAGGDQEANEPMILVESSIAPGVKVDQPLQVSDHAVNQNVRWDILASKLYGSGTAIADKALGGAAWMPILQANGRILLAVKSGPERQVWVGVDPSEWADLPEFVIFWTNVFDWAGRGADRFASHNLSELAEGRVDSPDLQMPSLAGRGGPGIHERDGARVAFNAPAPRLRDPEANDWRSKLSADGREFGRSLAFAPFAIVTALVSLAAAAASWRSDRGRQSAGTTELSVDMPGEASAIGG